MKTRTVFVLPEKVDWHRWFAWYPVYCEDSRFRWLETVERKVWACDEFWGYTYRGIQ